MHRDKKIGLALAVLLVGVTAALFFRNQKPDGEPPPELNDTRSLDEQIAEKPVAPYLPGTIEPDESGFTAVAAETAGVRSQESEDRGSRIEDRDTAASRSAQSSSLISHPSSELTQPGANSSLTNDQPDRQSSIINRQSANRGWLVGSGDAGAAPAPADFTLYKVRPGDTLWEIARELLGSSVELERIFEANRDILNSPHDLRAGMTIRIPTGHRPQGGPAAGTNQEAGRQESAVRGQGSGVRSQGSGEDRGSRIEDRTQDHSPLTTHDSSTQSSIDTRQSDRTDPPSTVPPRGIPETSRDPDAAPAAHPGSMRLPARRFIPVRHSPFLPRSSSDDRPNAEQRIASPSVEVRRPSEAVEPALEGRRLSQTPPADAPQVEAGNRSYEVRRGDSLEEIAVRVYGTRRAARQIFNANRHLLNDPDAIRPGMTLRLP